jgi:hypothetical protein
MTHFQAQLMVNQIPVWEAQGADYTYLQVRLLSQLEAEKNGAAGQIQEKRSQAILFRCRKVATE